MIDSLGLFVFALLYREPKFYPYRGGSYKGARDLITLPLHPTFARIALVAFSNLQEWGSAQI